MHKNAQVNIENVELNLQVRLNQTKTLETKMKFYVLKLLARYYVDNSKLNYILG